MTRGLTLTLTPSLRGAKVGRGSHAVQPRVLAAFFPKNAGRSKDPP